MTARENRLPDKLSDCVFTALEDLAFCESSDDYEIDMDVWHDWQENTQKCAVCLAGATLRGLGIEKEKSMTFADVTEFHSRVRLFALDRFRIGMVVDAAHPDLLPSPLPDNLLTRISRIHYSPVCAELRSGDLCYEDDPNGWKAAMVMIASELKKVGL